MELDKLIPDIEKDKFDSQWVVNKNFLMFRKIHLLPICYVEDNIAYIILDNKIRKEVIKITKHLVELNIEFYFTTPLISNPSGVENLENEIIYHYFYSYSQKEFYLLFNKIEFDIINNMVKWASKFGYYDLIKPNYERVLKSVNYKSYDFYSNKYKHEHSESIRNTFNGLYREIQINSIL